jgi:hypothetical protein
MVGAFVRSEGMQMSLQVASTVRLKAFRSRVSILAKTGLNRVAVRAVGRQEEEASVDGRMALRTAFPYLAAEITDDDDIAGLEGRNEHLRDKGAVAPQGRQGTSGFANDPEVPGSLSKISRDGEASGPSGSNLTLGALCGRRR